jgi:hypothetical protein
MLAVFSTYKRVPLTAMLIGSAPPEPTFPMKNNWEGVDKNEETIGCLIAIRDAASKSPYHPSIVSFGDV